MEGILKTSLEQQGETDNFHQVFEDRLRIKKIANDELGITLKDNENGDVKNSSNSPLVAIFDKYYKEEYDELNKKAKK